MKAGLMLKLFFSFLQVKMPVSSDVMYKMMGEKQWEARV